MGQIGFHFPHDESDQWEGFNDPGMEHFAGDPFVHLGRETTQNALDAPSGAGPVRVRFSQFNLPVSEIPDIEQLQDAVKRCKASAGPSDAKAKRFFDNALKLLAKKRISVLKIEDFNTKGLTGPCENGKPFFALLKALGQSVKENAAATGSFGIGKFAPFVVSQLRTIFVSTVWLDEATGKHHHYVQGKSRLMSHKAAGKTKKATGFWGVVKGCRPVTGSPEAVPEWLRRAPSSAQMAEHRGTTLFVLGFPENSDWRELLAATVAENFFGAILNGDLVVEIENAYSLDAENIHDIFANSDIASVVKEQYEDPDRFRNAAIYCEALTSNDAFTVDKEQMHLGHLELRILVRDGLPKRVAALRNGMFITDELNKLRRFGDFKDFAAVLRCLAPKGNELLRDMEPPRHDTFEPARLTPAKRQNQGRAALNEVGEWVRDMLRRYARDPVADVTKLDELAQYFADEDSESNDGKRTEINPSGEIRIAAKKLPPLRAASSIRIEAAQIGDEDDDGLAGEEDAAEPKANGGGASGQQSDSGGREADGGEMDAGPDASGGGSAAGAAHTNSIGHPMVLNDVRAVAVTAKKRRVFFTPGGSGLLSLDLQAAGADSNRPLKVSASDQGLVTAGRLTGLEVKAGVRMSVEVELGENYAGAIRVVGDAV